MKPTIIAGFPGIGQRTLHNLGVKYTTILTDSADFPDQFPIDYIYHIQDVLKTCKEDMQESDPNDQDDLVDFIFVSAHPDVLAGLDAQKIPYTLVYPDPSLKDHYLERYIDRGDPQLFIQEMNHSWKQLIHDMTLKTHPKKIVLQENQFLSDILGEKLDI